MEVFDFLDYKYEKNDIFMYYPGAQRNSSFKVGVFVGLSIAKVNVNTVMSLDDKAYAKVIFANEFMSFYAEETYISIELFKKRSFILYDIEFRLNNPLILKAFEIKDNIKNKK